MAEEEKEEKTEASKPISRREFAKGSMAVLGAYTSLSQYESPPPRPLSEAAKALNIDIPKDVQPLLDERHITEDDLRRVIDHAESTGLKLYQPGTEDFLSKLRIQKVYFYVEYSLDKDTYQIRTAYAHRFNLEGE
jgi:hypothetical protein